jgi:hypothetical protein
MKTKLWTTLISLCVMFAIFNAGLAEGAGTGTLKFTFKYKDPTTGVDTNVGSAFIYLHNATKPPPLEKFFSKADQILWGSLGDGSYSTTGVPEGTYYIRINQRANPANQNSAGSLGPPQIGDLTWMQTAPVTIIAGQTLDLGTLYAVPFAFTPITITGTVRSWNGGSPLAGRYVRAQTRSCSDTDYCGPVKDLALQPTDANGKYTLILRDPGTYYLYTSACLSDEYREYTGNVCPATAAPGPVKVKIKDNITVDFVVYR